MQLKMPLHDYDERLCMDTLRKFSADWEYLKSVSGTKLDTPEAENTQDPRSSQNMQN